jgi:hemolysin activation/secretion protein
LAGDGTFASGQFTKVDYGLSFLQRIFRNNSILLRVNGQYSNDLLTSLEQFSLGGPESVRAYSSSEYLGDSGLLTSLEYTVAAPGFSNLDAFWGYRWGRILHFSAFTDMGWNWINKPSLSEQHLTKIAGYGLGVELNVPQKLMVKFQVARPFSAGNASSRTPLDRHSIRYWFNFYFLY